MTEILHTTRYGRVLRVALNRPEKRNALNAALCRALLEAVEQAETDPTIGAVLLTGNGKSFCSGMDLSETGPGHSEELNRAHEQVFTIGSRLTKPIIGAINGSALGGGMGLVANCHIVVASDDATFGLTEIRLGLWPFLIYRAVSAAIGDRRTAELSLTGRIFDAREAEKFGLVHEISHDLEDTAADVATSITRFSPTAISAGLRFVRDTRGKDLETAGAIARRMRNEVFVSDDFQEGVSAFHEKRPARWPSLGAGG
jgi:enoyl-CoA hydratase/carnithine racemase